MRSARGMFFCAHYRRITPIGKHLPQRAQRPQRNNAHCTSRSLRSIVQNPRTPRGLFQRQFSRKKAQKAQKEWSGFCAFSSENWSWHPWRVALPCVNIFIRSRRKPCSRLGFRRQSGHARSSVPLPDQSCFLLPWITARSPERMRHPMRDRTPVNCGFDKCPPE